MGELKYFLESHYPELAGNIRGENFPPPPLYEMINSVVGVVQMASFVYLFFGENLLSALGVADNAFLRSVTENKFMVIVGMFIMSSVSQSLIATGAFEVYVGYEKVYSKIEMGRMPSVPELIENLRKLGFDYV